MKPYRNFVSTVMFLAIPISFVLRRLLLQTKRMAMLQRVIYLWRVKLLLMRRTLLKGMSSAARAHNSTRVFPFRRSLRLRFIINLQSRMFLE
jgi:hypothetical protein